MDDRTRQTGARRPATQTRSRGSYFNRPTEAALVSAVGTRLLPARRGGSDVCPDPCRRLQMPSLNEVRGKTAFGPEYQDLANNTDQIRYDVTQGIELRWDNGWTTGVSNRYRWIEEGPDAHEDRILFEVGYPLWKAPKPDKTAERMEALEREVAYLRAQVPEASRAASASDLGAAATAP